MSNETKRSEIQQQIDALKEELYKMDREDREQKIAEAKAKRESYNVDLKALQDSINAFNKKHSTNVILVNTGKCSSSPFLPPFFFC